MKKVAKMNKVIHGDCLDELKQMEDNSIDAIVTDPPYGIKFMGKKWDYDIPTVEVWQECLRVLKPGGHALIACGTRTQHRMAVNIEDARFEIRDTVAWIYGSGFPKSLDISKAIDKQAGVEREVDVPITPEAIKWQGWGTALKPTMELWTLARKPIEGTVAGNVLKYGAGGLNIDGCRVEVESWGTRPDTGKMKYGGNSFNESKTINKGGEFNPQGRFPANLIHDGSDEVVGLFPDSNSKITRFKVKGRLGGIMGDEGPDRDYIGGYDDSGPAARFFYCAKASKADRNEGLEGVEPKEIKGDVSFGQKGVHGQTGKPNKPLYSKNTHPTVKPTKLMQYLCRLITPPGGLILDPYCGSGSTGKAAIKEGFDFIGIDSDGESVNIARARIEHELKKEQQLAFI